VKDRIPPWHWSKIGSKAAGQWLGIAIAISVVVLILGPQGSPKGPGLKDKTWWDWLELAGVPATLAGLGLWFQQQQRKRDEEERAEQREGTAVTKFIEEMQPLLLDKNLRQSEPNSEVRSVARALTLATLSQLKIDVLKGKELVLRFLADADLIEARKSVVSLDNANLSGANLSAANLSGADLSGADLSGADLRGAKLSGADLIGADLIWADLSGANLSGAALSRANLIGANLSGAFLREADLSRAILIGANLSRAFLREADLSGADLREANLIGANLSGANLSGADLIGADLEDINWDKETKWPPLGDIKNLKNAPTKLKAELGIK
jgi:uncharacterized protein YjbI with pentapeptide repeats